MSAATEVILDRLAAIERAEGVRILYACESGSRAWGFPSRDADYDVRFIYLRPCDWYLSIDVETKRDVIELPIDDLYDINGWDLRKALKLLRKLNPPCSNGCDRLLFTVNRKESPASCSPLPGMEYHLRLVPITT